MKQNQPHFSICVHKLNARIHIHLCIVPSLLSYQLMNIHQLAERSVVQGSGFLA